MMRDLTLVESEGIMQAHKKPAPKEEELRTVKRPRKPGQGTPQNPPKQPERKQ